MKALSAKLTGFFKEKNADGKTGGDDGAPSGLVFSISLPLALCLAILALCAVVWSFYIGFMAGRGEHPGSGLRSMASFMKNDKEAGHTENAPQTAVESADAAAAAQESAPQPAAQAAVALVEGAKKDASQKAPYPFNRPEGQQKGAWGEAEKRDAVKAKTAEKPGKSKPANASAQNAKTRKGPLYDFSYQTAAFKSQKDAANLQKKLRDMGVRASLQKSGKAQLVMVSLRGTDADAQELRRKLQSLKLGKPLLLSKKEAPAKGARRAKGAK